MEFLAIPIVIYINAFLTGIFTKFADIANDDGFEVGKGINIFMGVLWGVFGSLVVFGSAYVAAFYLGILLSWIFRFKLDNYSHGIGGTIVLLAIFFVHPVSLLQLVIAVATFLLFTLFGLLSRHKIINKGFFVEYNLYSFLFLIILAFYYPAVWVVVWASLSNVVGYHGVKKWWAREQQR